MVRARYDGRQSKAKAGDVARELRVSDVAAIEAVRAGRITPNEDKAFDLDVAKAQEEGRNRKRPRVGIDGYPVQG